MAQSAIQANVVAYVQCIQQLASLKTEEAKITERLKTLQVVILDHMKNNQTTRIVHGNLQLDCVLKESAKAVKPEVKKARLLNACQNNEQHAGRIWDIVNGKEKKQDFVLSVMPLNPLTRIVRLEDIK